MPCARCGESVTKPFRFYGRAYHVECAVSEMSDANRQMSEKSGPYYRLWLEAGGANGRPKSRGRGIETAWADTFDASIYVRL